MVQKIGPVKSIIIESHMLHSLGRSKQAENTAVSTTVKETRTGFVLEVHPVLAVYELIHKPIIQKWDSLKVTALCFNYNSPYKMIQQNELQFHRNIAESRGCSWHVTSEVLNSFRELS